MLYAKQPADSFGCQNWVKVILGSSKSRLGMLLNTLPYAEQPPTTKNYLAHYAIGIMVEKY